MRKRPLVLGEEEEGALPEDVWRWQDEFNSALGAELYRHLSPPLAWEDAPDQASCLEMMQEFFGSDTVSPFDVLELQKEGKTGAKRLAVFLTAELEHAIPVSNMERYIKQMMFRWPNKD